MKKMNFDPYISALIIIFAVNVFLKWRYFYGLVMADDFSYGVYSYSLFRIPLPWDMSMDFRVLRFSFLLPVALLFTIFTPTEFVAVLYPLAASFGTIFVVYLIGRKLYGPKAGIFAAFIMATFPTDIRSGTLLLPGIVVTFFLSLAVWFFLSAESESGKKAGFLYMLSGLSVFFAFNARENSYYFLLFFLPFLFNVRRWKNGLYLIGLGFILPVFLLYTFYYFKTGDFLYNLHLAQKYRDPLIESGYIPGNLSNWYLCLYYMFPGFFNAFNGKSGFINPIFGFNFVLGVPFLLYITIKSLVKHDWKLLIVPWWFLIVYLYHEFGTISFEQYQMMRKLARFLLILTPALALGYGIVMSDIISGVQKRIKQHNRLTFSIIPGIVLIGLIVILHIFSLFFVLIINKYNIEYAVEKYRWAYCEVLKDKPHLPVFSTGGWWFNKLSFYFLPDLRYADVSWKRSSMLRDLKEVKEPSALAESYMIIDRSHFNGDNDLNLVLLYDNYGSYLQLPPPEWKLLANRHNVEIYEIPEGWKYNEPAGKEIALGSFRYALQVKDLMLAIQSLHPDFVKAFTGDQFRVFIQSVMDLNSTSSKKIFEERVHYRMYNGKWKILFLLN